MSELIKNHQIPEIPTDAQEISNPTQQSVGYVYQPPKTVSGEVITIIRNISGKHTGLTPKEELHHRIWSVRTHERFIPKAVMPKSTLAHTPILSSQKDYILARTMQYYPGTIPGPEYPPDEILSDPDICHQLGLITMGQIVILVATGCLPDIGLSASDYSQSHSGWSLHPLKWAISSNILVSPSLAFPDPDWIIPPSINPIRRSKNVTHSIVQLAHRLKAFSMLSNSKTKPKSTTYPVRV